MAGIEPTELGLGRNGERGLAKEGDGGDKRLEVYPPIHRLGVAGRWARNRLQDAILHGTPVLLRIQALRAPPLNGLMQASSFLGEEEFYVLLVSLVAWIADASLAR